MNILVTGGTGFLGRYLVKQLVQSGHHVSVITRKAEPYFIQEVQIIEKNILHLSSEDLEPFHTVIHSAGLKPSKSNIESDYFEINSNLTQHLLEIAMESNLNHFIHVSTTSVFIYSNSGYVRSKQLAEKAVEQSEIPWTIVRPSYIFGADGGFWESLIVRLQTSKKYLFLKGSSGVQFHPVYVKDVVSGILACIGNTKSIDKKFTLSGTKPISYLDFYKTLKTVGNLQFTIVTIPRFIAKICSILIPALKVDNVSNEFFTHQAALDDIHYQPTQYDEALRDTLSEINNV